MATMMHASLFNMILFAAGISLVGDRGLYGLCEAAICPFHLLRRIVFMLDKQVVVTVMSHTMWRCCFELKDL